MVQGFLALVALRIDLSYGQEDHVLEVSRKQALDPEQCMHAGAAMLAHQYDRGGQCAVERPHAAGIDQRRAAGEQGIRTGELGADGRVVPLDQHAQCDHQARYQHGQPAAGGEFFHQRDHQDRSGDRQAQEREGEAHDPARLAAMAPPVDAQAKQRQAEGQEHIDAVQHHQDRNLAVRPQQDQQTGHAHDDDAVLPHQPGGEIAEMPRHPVVRCHVRQHRRAVQEAGLRAHEQQPGLGGQQHREQRMAGPCRAEAEMVDDAVEDHGVQRLALHRGCIPKHIQQDNPARREGQ